MISIVIPAFNSAATVTRCLESLERQTTPRDEYEIILVDDGSTDGTSDLARREGVRVIRQENAGPAAARNRGVEAAQGELILFTDADCEAPPDWVECFRQVFSDPSVAGAKGTIRTRQRSLVARFAQLEYEDKYDRLAHRAHIDFIDTGSAAYRRGIFVGNGGFDTNFSTASGEDVDLSYRLAQRGYCLVFAPQAWVYHPHPTTVRTYARRKYRVGYWRVRMYKNHPAKMIDDSHTPQSLKLEMLLATGAVGVFAPGILYPPAFAAAGVLALFFLLTTLPFVVKAWRKDRAVAVVAPLLLLIRSWALSAGFAAGVLGQAFR